MQRTTTKTNKFLSIVLFSVLIILALCFTAFGGARQAAHAANSDNPDEINKYLEFTVSTGSYQSGNVSRSEVLFTISFTNAESLTVAGALSVEYYTSTTLTNENPIWRKVPAEGFGVPATVVSSATISGGQQSFHEYVFFRTVYAAYENNATKNYYYYQEDYVELHLDSVPATSYRIQSITASYIEKDKNGVENVVAYDAESNPKWVASEITFTITPVDASADALFYYAYGADDISDADCWYPATGNRAVLTQKEAYAGIILFRSTGQDANVGHLYEGSRTVRMDKTEPYFAVTMEKEDGTPYKSEEWTYQTVIYTVTPPAEDALKPISERGSGATYYYATERNIQGAFIWEPMKLRNNEYYVAIDTRVDDLYFKAESAAGKVYDPQDVSYATYIDKTAPILYLAAEDASGTPVYTRGTPPAANYKVGYASDSIVFSAANNASNIADVYLEFYRVPEGTTLTPEEEEAAFADNSQKASQGTFSRTHVVDLNTITYTYKFRARSVAGLISEQTFTVSVLPSAFTFQWETAVSYPDGWGAEALPVQFRVSNYLDTDDEYAFFYRVNSTYVRRPLSATRIGTETDEAGNRYSIFEAYLNFSVNNELIEFFAVSHADDESEALITERALKLDLVTPEYEVVRRLYNSTVEIPDGGWANGRVEIIITPAGTNLSGVTCYPILGGEPTISPIAPNGAGAFVRDVRDNTGGTYWFLLRSGAGKETRFSVTVYIDTSDIALNGIEAQCEVAANKGTAQEPLSVTAGVGLFTINETVSGDVEIAFLTNHATANGKHYTYYYKTFTESSPGSTGYTQVSDSAVLHIPVANLQASVTGVLRYAFYLESTAVNAQGERSRTGIYEIQIRYDITDFQIDVAYINQGLWVFEPVTFVLDVVQANIAVKEYQYRLVRLPGTAHTSETDGWLSIPNSATATNFQWVFAGEDQIQDPITGNWYKGFNGNVQFRAISTTGKASDAFTAGLSVKIDSSEANPLYAVVSNPNAKITAHDTEADHYYVYSNGTVPAGQTYPIQYQDPTSKAAFRQLSDYSFVFISAAGWEAQGNTGKPASYDAIAQAGGTVLGGGAVYQLTGKVYLAAKNNFKEKLLTISCAQETVAPTATMTAVGAAKNAAGVYVYEWTNEALITLSVTSQTAVYYYYSYVVSGKEAEWICLNPDVAQGGGGVVVRYTVRFLGSENNAYPNAIVGNFDSMVQFKVVNLAGSEARFDVGYYPSVHVRIDTAAPYFGVTTMVDGAVTNENDWYAKPIEIMLFPAKVTQGEDGQPDTYEPVSASVNPGGVIYQYRLAPQNSWENLPNTGTEITRPDGSTYYMVYFTTNDLINTIYATNAASGLFSGNGEITIYFRATARASGNEQYVQVTVRIDQASPEFTLQGLVKRSNGSDETIVSGTWVSADEIEIVGLPRSSGAQLSGVLYEYTRVANPEEGDWQTWNDIHSPMRETSISDFTVRARSGAGLTCTQTYLVRIDKDAPVIDSGIIDNRYIYVDGEKIIDRQNPPTYYIDQIISYYDANLKYARYNGFPLISGQHLGTDNVEISNTGDLPGGKGGYVHIIVEDLAGNRTELIFYMTVFELDINSITLSSEHIAMLEEYEAQYDEAILKGSLTGERQAYFRTQIIRLWDRVQVLRNQIADYQAYLEQVNGQSMFTLDDDYAQMQQYINYFETKDENILYEQWQQDMIKAGVYAGYYQKLEAEFRVLDTLMDEVRKVEEQAEKLPAPNVVKRTDDTAARNTYNAYINLSTAQKGQFKPTSYTKMMEVRHACDMLRLTDEDTGVNIRGETLASGAELKVLEVERNTDAFVDAQTVLLNILGDARPRAIIHIHQLGLSNVSSNYNTGTVTVTLPIPELYKEYKKFAVYTYVNNTIVPVTTFTIDAFGQNVYFDVTKLETYILAVGAEITDVTTDEKVYFDFFNIPIDATLMQYIAYTAIGLFAVVLILLIVLSVRHRGFLKRYNKNYKKSLQKRGLKSAVPKGNPAARTNPADVKKKFDYDL